MVRLACFPHRQLPRWSTECCFSAFGSSGRSSLFFFDNGEISRLPALKFSLRRSQIQMSGAQLGSTRSCGGIGRARRPNASAERFSSPKTGSVGTDRFKDGAVPGTYWNESLNIGEEVVVSFNTGSKNVNVNCRAGDNLLKIAETSGVMIPTHDFCFEGSCCHCEMEVEGGAIEVGYRADSSGSELIRSCICPVPEGRDTVLVNVLSDEDVWGAGIL